MRDRPIGSKWLWFALFAFVWLVLRVFWLDGDSGIPALWEYGFNVTDEGYYMGAGKDKFLNGAFCDLARGESFTYGYSPLTHWLSYAAYCVCGLSDWAWRIPFVAVYFLAWLMVFAHVRKRCGNVGAFVGCAILSSLPVVIAYERTACNDVLIAALAGIAFCLASGKGLWRIFGAAFVAGAITLVKPSVYVILPIVAAGILTERKTKYVWLDLVLFAAAAVASLAVWRGLAIVSLLPEVSRHGMSAAEVLRRTTTHNPLPSLLDYDQLLRGFSSFPRDICFKAFSGVGLLMTAVPLTLAAMDILRKRWSWRILLYLAVCAYVAGISVNNTICLHYYHPMLVLLPVVLAAAWEDLRDDASSVRLKPSFVIGVAVLALAGAALIAFFAVSTPLVPKDAIGYFSNISNLPQKIVWGLNGSYAVSAGALAVVCLACLRGVRAVIREGAIWFLCAFVSASVALSTLAIPSVARHVHLRGDDYTLPMALALVCGLIWVVLAFGFDGALRRKAFAAFLPAVIVLSFVLTPSWRTATVELLRPSPHVQKEIAREIAKIAPTNSVVIGERSSQVLMGKAYRTATTMPGCDPIPIVRQLFKVNPHENVFALLDSQNAYNLQHFQQHKDEFALIPVSRFKMASFSTGAPADVYFCKVVPKATAK